MVTNNIYILIGHQRSLACWRYLFSSAARCSSAKCFNHCHSVCLRTFPMKPRSSFPAVMSATESRVGNRRRHAAVMKQYLFDSSHIYLIAKCIKQQAVRKFVLTQSVPKHVTFISVSQFFGGRRSLEVCSEVEDSKTLQVRFRKTFLSFFFYPSFIYSRRCLIHRMSLHNQNFGRTDLTSLTPGD